MNIGFDEFAGCVPTVDFTYPDEGDEPASVVRDQWREAPLITKCQQRFAVVPSGDVMTMPLLDKRLEVLRYALREAVEHMDFSVIHQLAEPLDHRNRRWLRICGFSGCGDGVTYWRKRTFRRGENMALDRARHCVQRVVDHRAKLAASERAQFVRETARPLCA